MIEPVAFPDGAAANDDARLADADLGLALDLPIRGVQLIEASAGTGKTFAVATLYARLVIECGLPVSRLLAVTFTEAATKELREQLRARLLDALALLQSPDPVQALQPDDADHARIVLAKRLLSAALDREGLPALLARLRRAAEQMDLAPIHTIHGFCQRALAEHALDAGQPLAAREVLLNEAALRHEVALEFWRLHSREPGTAEALLSIWKSPAQLAGFLQDAMAWDVLLPAPEAVDPADTTTRDTLRAARIALAQAFAAHGEAAHELVRRARADEVLHAGSISDAIIAKAWAALHRWGDHAHCDPGDEADKVAVFTSANLQLRARKGKQALVPTSPLFDAIEAWDAACTARKAALLAARVAMVHAARDFAIRRSAELKAARGEIGFDDMIRGVHAALEGPAGAGFAAALQRQYAIALVDEFQDTDPRQWAIFRRLFATPAAADGEAPRALFLIGDPKQAIYRFRGGDVATYLQAQAEADAIHPLRRNFRSRPRALAAVEALFTLRGPGAFDQPGIAFEHVAPGGACDDGALCLDGADAPALVVMPIPEDPDDTGIDRARALATAACVSVIHGLLSASQAGQARMVDRHGVERAIAPGDISVLVPANRDAATMQRALAALGIPSVAAGRSSLYKSDEARHVCWLLEALLAPSDDGRLRATLATPLFGLDAARIAAFDRDLADHRAWQDRLEQWQACARRHGPIALLDGICAEQAPRLLGWPDGERRLSNYLQLAEDLQSAEGRAPGLAGLLSDLEQRIADADDRNDADLPRLESDGARVRLMTLHVSKGLTLDLVFLPYAATSGRHGNRSQPATARHHLGTLRAATLWPGKDDPVCKEDAREERAQDIRLLYVGLTRARLCTWLGWGAVKGAKDTALGWLLHRPQRAGIDAGDMARTPAFTADETREAMLAWQARAPGAIAIAAPVAADAPRTLPRLRFAEAATPAGARTARRGYDRDWWVYSFSQLAREEGVDAAPAPADDELDSTPPMERGRYAGPRYGNALHLALERVDPSAWLDWRGPAPPTGQLDEVTEALVAHGFDNDADRNEGVLALSQLVGETLNAPMPEGTRLALLPPTARLSEMEFHLALAPVQVDALLALLHAHGIVDARQGFGLRRRMEGLLTGSIDLVYEAGGRYYVLDYKSNQLPDYAAAALPRAIREGEYDLQYILYSLALHRWLRFRLGAAYDPRVHLGGVRYLFCRGLDRDDPAQPGIHALTLPPMLVTALDHLLGGSA
jgi:exodeoxyribonuclease V beta subunit